MCRYLEQILASAILYIEAVRLWNELPQALEAVNSLPNFKAAFKSRALEEFLAS